MGYTKEENDLAIAQFETAKVAFETVIIEHLDRFSPLSNEDEEYALEEILTILKKI